MTTGAILSKAEHERVAAAIRGAEKTTSGEIVCVLARASDSYFYPAAFALAAGMLALSVPAALWLDRSWWAVPLWQFVAAQIAAWGAALALIGAFPKLRIMLVPPRSRYRRAHRHALAQFLGRNIHATDGRTGVLIFLSLAERYGEVVADAGIAGRVAQEDWDGLVARLTAHAAAGRIAEGFEQAVGEAGALLAREFPPGAAGANELEDRLIEI